MELKKSEEFIKQLKENTLKTPNDFSKEMGKLIREAREELGLSQDEFAQKINRRRPTVSHIETGKSDISISTLALLAIELGRPISYFFPDAFFKEALLEFDKEELEIIQIIRDIVHSHDGDYRLTKKMLETFRDYWLDESRGEPEWLKEE